MEEQNSKGFIQSILQIELSPIIEEICKDRSVRRYQKGKFLGKGGFAKCYEMIPTDTKKVMAAKVIPKASLTKNRAKQKLMSEIKIHKSLQHTNIVGFEHFFEDNENVYIILELCTNQTMNELIRRRKRLTELEVQCYLMQMLSAIIYLHKNKVIHRDLKLGNLFLSEKMEIKLGDFGLATKVDFEGERKKTICGTPNYIAPEILEGKTGHSYEVDIWSLGVIAYTLLVGKPPFETNDVKTTYRRIRMNAYTFPEHVVLSQAAKYQTNNDYYRNLITIILQTDPCKRPTLEDIESHEFFNTTGSIPRLLPVSTLACPPSSTYLRQFQAKEVSVGKPSSFLSQQGKDFENTAPAQLNKQASFKSQKSVHQSNMVASVQHIVQSYFIFKVNKAPLLVEEALNLSNKQLAYPSSHYQSQGAVEFCQSKQTTFKSVDRFQFKVQPVPTDNPLNQNYFQDTLLKGPAVWIKKWYKITKQFFFLRVDYSSKYGLGYLLQNGQSGVFFNDCSKIILASDSEYFHLIHIKREFVYFDRGGEGSSSSLSNYPESLQKKVTLLHHFRNYLLDTKTLPISLKPSGSIKLLDTNPIYVKKWVKSKHAIMFRFSDKTVQVVFTDTTQVILTQQLRVVTYLNKQQEKNTMLLSHALESECNEMVKRLKYTKEILSQMLSTNEKQNNSTQRASQERIQGLMFGQVSKQNTQGDNNKNVGPPLQEQINKLNTFQNNQSKKSPIINNRSDPEPKQGSVQCQPYTSQDFCQQHICKYKWTSLQQQPKTQPTRQKLSDGQKFNQSLADEQSLNEMK